MSKKIIIGVCLLAMACFAWWFFKPAPNYDIERVHPRLRELQQPYQSVKTGYFMDGGSIGVEIIDRNSKREQFSIPAHLGDTNHYAKVFVGAMHDQKSGAVEIPDPEPTKRMLIHVIASMPHRSADDDLCLMALTRRPIDVARFLIHRWRPLQNVIERGGEWNV